MKNIDPGPTLGLHEGFEVKKKIKTIKPKELQLRHYHVSKPPIILKSVYSEKSTVTPRSNAWAPRKSSNIIIIY